MSCMRATGSAWLPLPRDAGRLRCADRLTELCGKLGSAPTKTNSAPSKQRRWSARTAWAVCRACRSFQAAISCSASSHLRVGGASGGGLSASLGLPVGFHLAAIEPHSPSSFLPGPKMFVVDCNGNCLLPRVLHNWSGVIPGQILRPIKRAVEYRIINCALVFKPRVSHWSAIAYWGYDLPVNKSSPSRKTLVTGEKLPRQFVTSSLAMSRP